jgi:hypothetical protein
MYVFNGGPPPLNTYISNMDTIKHIHIKHGPPLNTYISNMDLH